LDAARAALSAFPTRRSSDLGRLSFYQKFARAKSFEAFYTVAEQLRSEPDDAISKYLVKDCQKQRLMDADQYRSFISHERVEEMKDRKSTRQNSSHVSISYAV